MVEKMPIVLSIAGFDPTCGAGVVADVKTFSTLGCYGLAVVTAITTQNTVRVRGSSPLQPELIKDQIDTLFEDLTIDAVKIGMLANESIVIAVAETLSRQKPKWVVIDTPIVSSSGYPLLSTEAIETLRKSLFPISTLITPNLAEAAALSGLEVFDQQTMREAAKRLHEMGADAVLVKGGHLEGAAIDLLYDGREYHNFCEDRIEGAAVHGTGCALSSAIVALLARGDGLVEAIEGAKRFITKAISEPFHPGKGAGLIRHF